MSLSCSRTQHRERAFSQARVCLHCSYAIIMKTTKVFYLELVHLNLATIYNILSIRVRCTINRSHSTPCKKAELEHLQFFSGHCLDFFLSVSGKTCHSPIKIVKRHPTLIISFSQYSPFSEGQSKNSGCNRNGVIRYLGSVPGSL